MYDLIGFKNTFFCWLLLLLSCGNHHQKEKLTQLSGSAEELSSLNTNIIIAANKTSSYLPMLMDKTVAVVANQTSVIFKSKSN
ncbi:MAG: DUF1343 domain-containing protein, partial [Eudoraea sp.]